MLMHSLYPRAFKRPFLTDMNVDRTFRLGEEFANVNEEFFEEPEVPVFYY